MRSNYNKNINFTVKIAGVAVWINCRYQQNKTFLKDYLTDEKPKVFISPTDEDLQKMRKDFESLANHEGATDRKYTEEFIENNAIHWLLAEKLIDYDVLLMHGSAVAVDGEAYLFTAKSGVGKSTHAQLWLEQFGDRAYIINDDKPMLKINNSGVTVYGTPWNGEHKLSRNTSAPLKAVIHITRDRINHIEPLSNEDAVPIIFRQAYRTSDSMHMMKVLQMEDKMLQSVKMYKLGCNMDKEAAVITYEGIKKIDKT